MSESNGSENRATQKLILSNRILWLCCGFVVIYCLGFSFEFTADYLGQSPVLDARENIAWAKVIDSESLPAEPLYRALLYPWMLAQLPDLALVRVLFGCACHFGNSILVGLIAQCLWGRRKSLFVLPSILYAMYPVSLYFAVQTLDITLGMSLFLGAVYLLLTGKRLGSSWVFGLCGVLAGLSVVTRPNFLLAVLMFPLLAYFLPSCSKERSSKWLGTFSVGASLLVVLLLQGLWNVRQSGDFRILPWQGAYNLYAANRAGANGQFYEQQVSFDSVSAGMNPTRMESEYLYGQAHPEETNPTVDAMSDYWREQLFAGISQDPVLWLRLMGRKVIYLFNDWEQYNNLSYEYQKERFVWLKWNPLGWGVLLLFAGVGFWAGWGHLSKDAALGLLLLVAAYAAGVLLFFVSARFRLPLAPMLCVGTAGLVYLPLKQFNRKTLLAGSSLLVIWATLAYGDWFDAKSEQTFVQDAALLGGVASRAGNDLDALKFSEEALAIQPNRPDLIMLRVKSLFNLWLMADSTFLKAEYWHVLGETLEAIEKHDTSTLFIEGIYRWRSGELEKATEAWHLGLQQFPSQMESHHRALIISDAITRSTLLDEALLKDPIAKLLIIDTEALFKK